MDLHVSALVLTPRLSYCVRFLKKLEKIKLKCGIILDFPKGL